MTISQDEKFKAAAHALLLGCAIPIVAYNISRRRTENLVVYAVFFGFELWHIVNHLRRAGETVDV